MYSKLHLLTGAGFTHNFGTPLASGIWSEIFNNHKIQTSSKLKKLLQGNFDYEALVHNVVFDDTSFYSNEEKEILQDAVKEAYTKIDNIVCEYSSNNQSRYPINILRVQDFINKFVVQDLKSFFFTLNQDLFIERHYYNNSKPAIPGIIATYELSRQLFSSTFAHEKFNENFYQMLPSQSDLDTKKDTLFNNSNFFYVKLHGSYNWRSEKSPNHMVIGKNKTKQIEEEPLLKLYLENFNTVLSSGNVKLFIIGYGFGDDHINKILADSIFKNDLMIYIMNPGDIKSFKQNLLQKEFGSTLFDGISGYYQYKLADVFPLSGENTQAYKTILESYFN